MRMLVQAVSDLYLMFSYIGVEHTFTTGDVVKFFITCRHAIWLDTMLGQHKG